jgi:hypothetical protein
VRAFVTLVAVGVPLWWGVQWHQRHVTETRLAVVASEIAGRPVHVHCPGVLKSRLSYEMLEGKVQFTPDGRPTDSTELMAGPCAELGALVRGKRGDVVACVQAGTADCPGEARLAQAIDVITHESFHLSGIADEADTECRSLQTLAWSANQLGVPSPAAERLAVYQAVNQLPLMPDRYREPCTLPGQAAPAAGR